MNYKVGHESPFGKILYLKTHVLSLKGMFTNILVLDSQSLSMLSILWGGSEEGEELRGREAESQNFLSFQ